MSIDFKYLVESPDDLYELSAEPICFGLVQGRWVYKKGMETHQRMMNEIRLQVDGEVPQNQFEWTIFPGFQTMEEENSWWGKMTNVDDLFWRVKRGDEKALREFYGISGRLSTAKPRFINNDDVLCAFWDTTEEVRKHLPELHQLFQHLGLDITKYKFDTLDGVKDKNELGYFSYKALTGNQQFAAARSPEEQQRLLQIQHIDPAAKRALGNVSVAGSAKYAKRAYNAGFPSVASFRNFATQESVIKEDPDDIWALAADASDFNAGFPSTASFSNFVSQEAVNYHGKQFHPAQFAKTWNDLPATWRKLYPKKFFGYPNNNVSPIALGITYKGKVEARKLKPHDGWYSDVDDGFWNLQASLGLDLKDFKWWKLGNNNVVSWTWTHYELPKKQDMDAVDSYLLQKGIRVFSHGDSLLFHPYSPYDKHMKAPSAIKFRNPDYYIKNPVAVISPNIDTPVTQTPRNVTMAQWHYAHGEAAKPLSFQDFCESSMTAGSGGAFGDFGSSYAAGDARVPFALGAIQRRPAFQRRRKRRKKK